MADQLYQTLAFTNVVAAGSMTRPHNINAGGAAYIPDEIDVDNSAFIVTGYTATTITVKNISLTTASCTALLKLWHSMTRALGTNTVYGNMAVGLTPRPFVAAGGGGAAGLAQTWLFTATGTEGNDFMVTLPVPHPTATYGAQATCSDCAVFLQFQLPTATGGDRTTTQMRVVTSVAVTAGDRIEFRISDWS